MPINADKPHLWKNDVLASVDLFNNWFLTFAPQAFRETRAITTTQVENALLVTKDFAAITPQFLHDNPAILPTLRMATCPPLARDRLSGLAYVSKTVVGSLEQGKVPRRMARPLLMEQLTKLTEIVNRMLDRDIFPWLAAAKEATTEERHRASTIVADRLCGSLSDPIIRNAQEKRQLGLIEERLTAIGYKRKAHPPSLPLTQMEPGTFSFRMNVVVGDSLKVNIPVDVVIQPAAATLPSLPLLIEAKSAGDFTNVNKRRKEEATKIHQLKLAYGDSVQFILFLCGYFDSGYLGYEAAEGIDWIWEHRIEDLEKLGL